MRSKRQARNRVSETAFEAELANFQKGLIARARRIQGEYVEPRRRLMRVCLDYVDELNKLRKHACPLSLNMLLSAVMESVLNVLLLEHSQKAAATRVWRRAETELLKGAGRLVPNTPVFTLAGLIEVIDELKLLRTCGVHAGVDEVVLDALELKLARFSGIAASINEFRRNVPREGQEAKQNSDLMHTLRGYRNSIHPLQVLLSGHKDGLGDFSIAIVNGLRLIVLLEHLLEIEPVVD